MSGLMSPPSRSGPDGRRGYPMTGVMLPSPAAAPRPQAQDSRFLPAGTVTILPYVMLAVCVMLTLVFQTSTPGTMVINLALSALAGAWILCLFTLHPGWRDRPRIMGVFYVGLLVIMAVLVVRATWYGLFTLTAWFYAVRLLRWPWPLLGAAAVGVMGAISQTYGISKTTSIGLFIFVTLVAVEVFLGCGFTYFMWTSSVQAEKRIQAVAELSEANRRLEASLAENAGLQAQLLAQAREAGALDERHRMAREIHDTLAQGLAGIITQLQAAEHAAETAAAWRRHVSAATALARESLSEARRSVDALRPEPLETARLSDALAGVAERWSQLNKIAVQFTVTGTVGPIWPEAELTLLRTAQEALANVARHAHATRVGLTLSYMEDEVALDVRDDGGGFDVSRLDRADGAGPADRQDTADGGFGLIAMRQRVEGLAGTLQVESEVGGGTAISACVPALPALPAGAAGASDQPTASIGADA
jgi:signal transduction histidine kinase